MSLTYGAIPSEWWPYVFILVAGTLATEVWRWLGVLTGAMLKPDSEMLVIVRAIATSFVACVVGTLILFPSGSLASTPTLLRVAAAGFGWLTYRLCRKSVLAGVAGGEAVLVCGWLILLPS